jgi:hypothetical protein
MAHWRLERVRYSVAAWLFARFLPAIYLVAFASLAMQAGGLMGAHGIVPAAALHPVWVCWAGAGLAAAAIFLPAHGVLQRVAFGALYVLYLVLIFTAPTFLSYQWDYLLIEAGFLAIFLNASPARVWVFQWLLFRLMLESGASKLLSHDPTWRNLTALSFHYETQPLPTPLAWYAAQAPMWFHELSTAFVLAAELVLPFLMCGPRRLKKLAAAGFVILQVLIFLTGNYTFFNLLAAALCIFLLDDSCFPPWFEGAADAQANRYVSGALVAFTAAVGCMQLAAMFGLPSPRAVLEKIAPLGIVNQYGLFASMTTRRYEISIEGSNDGAGWRPYVFRYKPEALDHRPRWVAPHQPRLDWQMWFAALGSYQENPWFTNLMVRLLEGSPEVGELFEQDPFRGRPPKYVRALIYEYHFTDFAERKKSGAWWRRELKGTYFPASSLRAPPAQQGPR